VSIIEKIVSIYMMVLSYLCNQGITFDIKQTTYEEALSFHPLAAHGSNGL